MSQWYTITKAEFEKTVKTKFGEFSAYSITVTDGDAGSVTCQLLQKPETPEPLADTRIHGYIEDSDYGFKFKKTQPEDQDTNSGQRSHAGGSQPSTTQANNDTQNQIIRQSSLKVAADLCIANKKDNKDIDVQTVLTVAEMLAQYAQTGSMGQAGGEVNQEVEDALRAFDEVPA